VAGDNEALRNLTVRFLPRLASFFRRRGLRRETLDDAVQETCVRLLHAVRSRRVPENRFDGWLFEVAAHVLADMRRSLARERRFRDFLAGRLRHAAEPPPSLPEWTSEVLRRALDTLPSPLREVLELRLSGLSYEAISLLLELSVGAVTMRLHRARRSLRRLRDDLL